MADVSANAATAARFYGFDLLGIAILSYAGELETRGDRDWVRLDVTAGRTYMMVADLEYSIYTQPAPFPIVNADGSAVATTSPAGGVYQFTAAQTGSVYVDVTSNYLPIGGYTYDILIISPERAVDVVTFGGAPHAGADRALTVGTGQEDMISLGASGSIGFGNGGDDYIYLNASGGTAHGGNGEDTLIGDGGGDFIFGGHGDDNIQGEFGSDFLYGEHGRDIIFCGDDGDVAYGGEGEDYITGDGGDDRLDGGEGADNLLGRDGDDRMFVDNVGDLVFENAGDGADTVFASVSYTISASAEIERLETTDAAGTAALKLTGNEFSQIVEGNDGRNTLVGLGGNDTLIGNGGADALSGGNGTDAASYSTSVTGVTVNLTTPSLNTGDARGDTYSSIENITGSRLNDILSGNAVANSIAGGSGQDTLNGLGGSDRLNGGGGRDHFVFNTALGAGNVDRIVDFSVADDTFRLENAVFLRLAAGALDPDAFKVIDMGPTDLGDRILYRSATGELFYDRDGSGETYGAIKFAEVTAATALTAADFLIV